ncbi:hypothetical protein GCM10010468_72100 [Actinocorallia longicatena]|uniref:Uncharacterized protein n=2 Tax=Actinocorallia longicatena TaxID=111803 RepID=A0ABP6QNB5_9ACTN
MSLRDAVERNSATPVVFLHQLPRWVLPLTVAALMLVGLVVRGPWGTVCLTVLALFLGWFFYLSWPRLDLTERLLRVAALALLVAFAAGDLI